MEQSESGSTIRYSSSLLRGGPEVLLYASIRTSYIITPNFFGCSCGVQTQFKSQDTSARLTILQAPPVVT